MRQEKTAESIGKIGRRAARFIVAKLLTPAFLIALACSTSMGANSSGNSNVALTVMPEAKISIQKLAAGYGPNEIQAKEEIGQAEERYEVRWFRVDILVRLAQDGDSQILFHNDSSQRIYVFGSESGDRAVPVAGNGKYAIQTLEQSGRYVVTLGIARSTEQWNNTNLNATLELKSSDGLLNVSGQM